MNRLALRLVALACAVGALQMGYAHLMGYKDAPSTVREFDRHMTEERDIIYFGDSTLYRGRANENGTQTTPEILQTLLPDRTVGGVYHDAYNPRLFVEFCRHMIRQPHRPEVIVVPINMRVFSPERLQRPEYSFVRERLYLRHDSKLFWAFYRPLAAFGAFDLTPVTQEDYLETLVYDGDTAIGTFGEIYARKGNSPDTDIIRTLYYYSLSESHPELEALVDIAELCAREGVRALFYVTPIDYELGNAMMEGEFKDRVRENVTVITSLLESRVEVIDLSFSLDSERFAERTFPESYLDNAGKRRLAERLAEAITAGPAAERDD